MTDTGPNDRPSRHLRHPGRNGWVPSAWTTRFLEMIRRGDRTVLWVPQGVNLGNFLYHWLHASSSQKNGRDVVALTTTAMEPWLPLFPAAAGLVVPRAHVSMTDRRELGMHQAWNHDFDREQLQDFIAGVVLTSPIFETSDHRRRADDITTDDVVINIRRGDYFSDPRHFARYSFNVDDYLVRALSLTAARGRIGRIHVVSDGIDWCRDHLAWLAEHGTALTFADRQDGPAENFATLGRARRLILTNTTFGYWGGYVSNVRHGNNHADVVAPWFHARIGDFAADQLDPAWSVVAEVDGGWDSVRSDGSRTSSP